MHSIRSEKKKKVWSLTNKKIKKINATLCLFYKDWSLPNFCSNFLNSGQEIREEFGGFECLDVELTLGLPEPPKTRLSPLLTKISWNLNRKYENPLTFTGWWKSTLQIAFFSFSFFKKKGKKEKTRSATVCQPRGGMLSLLTLLQKLLLRNELS